MSKTLSIHHLCAWSRIMVALARPTPKCESGPHSQGLPRCMATIAQRLMLGAGARSGPSRCRWLAAGAAFTLFGRSYPELGAPSNATPGEIVAALGSAMGTQGAEGGHEGTHGGKHGPGQVDVFPPPHHGWPVER